jgi:hypothetical protein
MSRKEAVAAGAKAFVCKVCPADTFITSFRNLADKNVGNSTHLRRFEGG